MSDLKLEARAEHKPPVNSITLLTKGAFAAIFLLLAAVVIRRVFSNAIEADRDVGLYAVQAREWLQGGWPYVAVWDLHPIGEPALITVAFALFGQSVEVIRMLGVIAVCITAVILCRVVAQYTRSDICGLSTGLIYVAYSSVSGGLAANNEVILGPFVTGGIALTIRSASRVLYGKRLAVLDVLLPGLSFGVALWIKQVAAPEAMTAFACLVGLAFFQGSLRLTAVPGLAVVFALACAGPTLLTATAYYLHGHLTEFVVAAVQAPLVYGAQARALALVPGEAFTAATRFAPLLAMSAITVVGVFRRSSTTVAPKTMLPIAAMIWLAATVCGALMPRVPYGHHFLIMLPPLSVLAALGLSHIVQLPWIRRNDFRTLCAALLALFFVGSVPTMAAIFHIRTAPLIDPLRRVSGFLKGRLKPTDTIFVVNAHPIIYFLADARIPGRYVFPDHLVENTADSIPGLNADAEVARILRQAPSYIILDQKNWATMRVAVRDMISRALEAHYHRSVQTDGNIELQIYQLDP